MSRDVLADYLAGVARIRGTRAGTGEISCHWCLGDALNGIGADLTPDVLCVPSLRNSGSDPATASRREVSWVRGDGRVKPLVNPSTCRVAHP